MYVGVWRVVHHNVETLADLNFPIVIACGSSVTIVTLSDNTYFRLTHDKLLPSTLDTYVTTEYHTDGHRGLNKTTTQVGNGGAERPRDCWS